MATVAAVAGARTATDACCPINAHPKFSNGCQLGLGPWMCHFADQNRCTYMYAVARMLRCSRPIDVKHSRPMDLLSEKKRASRGRHVAMTTAATR